MNVERIQRSQSESSHYKSGVSPQTRLDGAQEIE